MASITLAAPLVRMLGSGMLFALTLISGLWLSGTGKPYQSLPFNVHKMAAVITVVILAIVAVGWYRLLDSRSLSMLTLTLVAGLLLLALVVTGSLLTLGIELGGLSLKIHQVLPLLALTASFASLYLLVRDLL